MNCVTPDCPSSVPGLKLAPPVTSRGKPVRLFTSHRKANAFSRAFTLQLQACARFVLEMLVMFADKQGRAFISARELANLTPRSALRPRYSLPHVLRSLRKLREAGIIHWTRVAPLSCFPARNGEGKGKFTKVGGRVWLVNFAALQGTGPLWTPDPTLAPPELAGMARGAWARGRARREAEQDLEADAGQEAAQATSAEAPATDARRAEQEITCDRGGSITHDRSSDTTSSRSLDTDPARATGVAREALAPLAHEDRYAGSRRDLGAHPPAPRAEHGRASSAPGLAPLAGQAASETPPSTVVTRASQSAETPQRTSSSRGIGATGTGEVTRANCTVEDAEKLDAILGPGWRGEVRPWRR